MRSVACLFLILLLACAGEERERVVSMPVTEASFEITVEGEGQLRAVKATPITVPPTLRPKTLAWILEEGTYVQEGDELLRFDNTDLISQKYDTNADLKALGYQMTIDERLHDQSTRELDGDIFLLDEERDQAEKFAPKDPTLFPRSEIIESEINLQFLDTKSEHFEDKKDRHLKKGVTQTDIHNLTRKSHELQLQQIEDGLTSLVVTAPHEGYFYFQRNWRNEAPQIGQMCWSGMKLGELPELSNMEARIHVLEKEAAGLKVGQSAELELDARPGLLISGSVKQVATLAKPLHHESPVKYFEVIISIDKTDPSFMRPGSLVLGRIFIAKEEKVITLPNQVLFREDQENYVFVQKGDRYERRTLTLGRRSPTRTVIESGLKLGEHVAMSRPEEHR